MTTTATVPAPPSSGRLPDPAPCRDRTLLHLLPGVALCGAVAAVACVVGPRVPSLGSPVVALLMGIGLAGVLPPGATARAGVRFVGRHGLQVGIVALGFGVSLHEVASTGFRSLPVMVPTFAVALVGARCFGGALGLGRVVRGLIGVGTAVCGASAIAAVAPVIAADEADVASAVSTIFVFNVAAVLLFPWVGHLLGLSQRSFGLWAGTAVNDTSSVVAAAFAYGHVAGAHAVVVKLTRSMAIVPICLVLAARRRQGTDGGDSDGHGGARRRVVPWFVVAFVAAAAFGSAGIVPSPFTRAASAAAGPMVTTSLAAIGLSLGPRQLRRSGVRPLLLGAGLWMAVAVTSLAVQAAAPMG